MRIPRDKLALWSVCALYQRATVAKTEPMKPDFSIKTILGFLFALSDGRHDSYDVNWQALDYAHPDAGSDTQKKYVRANNLRTNIEGIMRGLKVGDPLFRHEVGEALRGPSRQGWTQHDRLIEHLKRERAETGEIRTKRGDCGWL